MKAELIDKMGTDLSVVNSARVSFSKESEWDWKSYDSEEEVPEGEVYDWHYVASDNWQGGYPVKSLKEVDIKLINYLAKHNHWTPFSHVMITMRETVPIFVARQRFKHMVGFTYNEVSRRYVDDQPEFYEPQLWRGAPENAKQGSSDKEIFWDDSGYHYEKVVAVAKDAYKAMIEAGVAPEQARMVLPQSMYTSYYVTGSLAAWARAYKLRSDPHAQKEIQDLAQQWNDIIAGIPELKHSWNALTS